MFDILSFAKDQGIHYELSGKNVSKGWVAFCCPYCNDSGYHLGVPLTGTHAYCWKCGSHPLDKTLMELTGLSWYELNNAMMDYDGSSSLLSIPKKVPLGTKIELPSGSMEEVHRKYLKRRGFDPDELQRDYGIYGTGMLGEWKYRIIIPIYEKDGTLVSFQGRDYTGKQTLRYKTLSVEQSVVNPKFILFNENHVKGEVVGVTEGPFDALNMGSPFVATLGTQTTEQQCRKIAIYEKAYIVFDPEPEAQIRAKKLAEKVASLGGNVEVIDIGGEYDPGSISKKEVEYIRKELDLGNDCD